MDSIHDLHCAETRDSGQFQAESDYVHTQADGDSISKFSHDTGRTEEMPAKRLRVSDEVEKATAGDLVDSFLHNLTCAPEGLEKAHAPYVASAARPIEWQPSTAAAAPSLFDVSHVSARQWSSLEITGATSLAQSQLPSTPVPPFAVGVVPDSGQHYQREQYQQSCEGQREHASAQPPRQPAMHTENFPAGPNTKKRPAMEEGTSNIPSPQYRQPGPDPSPGVEHIETGNHSSSEQVSSSISNISIKKAFKDFLLEEQRKGVILLHEETEQDVRKCNGIRAWDVRDVPRWWEDTKNWYASRHDTWTEKTFFMALRRMGLLPYNLLRPTVSSFYDFRLERKDVQKHGYRFDIKMWERYNKSGGSPTGGGPAFSDSRS